MPVKAGYIDSRRIVTLPSRMLMTAVRPSYRKEPEKVSAKEILKCLSLPFRPEKTMTLMRLDRFEDLPIDEISAQVRALIIDVDGTLTKPGTEFITDDIIKKLIAIRERMPVCVFPDDQQHMPDLERHGIPVVRHVPPKTDPRSYDVAVQLYLQNQCRVTRQLYPDQCATVGDNFLTDGSCRETGMKFIHVRPVEGRESTIRTLTRNFADGVARLHDLFRKPAAVRPAGNHPKLLPPAK